KYKVATEVARGGMGAIFKGSAPDGSIVAIKILIRPGAAQSLARFERERRLLESLGEKEGFVPLLDAGQTFDGPYLVMPFVEGGTLRTRLEKGPLEVDFT